MFNMWRKPFLRHKTNGAVGHLGGNEHQLLGIDGNGPSFSSNVESVCKEVFCSSWLCIVCFREQNALFVTALWKLMKSEAPLHSQRT